jgi:hypothetical protein
MQPGVEGTDAFPLTVGISLIALGISLIALGNWYWSRSPSPSSMRVALVWITIVLAGWSILSSTVRVLAGAVLQEQLWPRVVVGTILVCSSLFVFWRRWPPLTIPDWVYMTGALLIAGFGFRLIDIAIRTVFE